MDEVEQIRSEIEAFQRAKYDCLPDRVKTRVDVELLIKRNTDEVLPSVLQIREERSSTGPLTKKDYEDAGLRHSHESLRSTLDRIGQRVGNAEPGFRRDVMAAIVANGEAFYKDMASLDLSDEEAAEARLKEITDDAVRRIEGLTEMMRNRTEDGG